MKNNWQTKRLGEVCNIQTGKKDVNQGNFSGEYPFFTCAREHTYSDEYSFDMEALLVAGNGDVGHVSYYKGKFEAYQRTYILSHFKNISAKFLYLFLAGFLKDTVSKQKLGNTMPYIKIGMLTEFLISVPPFVEQQRIVKILDNAFEKIEKAKENAEKNLQNSKELFESYSQSVFNNPGKIWEKGKIIDVFQIKPPKREAKEKLKDDDLVSFVPMEDLEKFSKEFVCVKERKLKDVAGSYTYFANEDVLLAKITPCFENGKLGIAKNLKNGIGFGSSEYVVFRSNGKVVPEYLYYFLARDKFRKEGAQRMSGAVGHKRVSKEFIEESILLFPKSLSEQKSIVAKLDKLFAETKKLEAIYKQKLAGLDELKKSILKKAFNGEL